MGRRVMVSLGIVLYEVIKTTIYLEKVKKGEEIIIGKHGKPVAKLVAVPLPKPRKPGALKNSLKIAKDFDKISQR